MARGLRPIYGKDRTHKREKLEPVVIDGQPWRFDSKLERQVFSEQLWPLMISKRYEVKQQVHVYLTRARILYVCDFSVRSFDGAEPIRYVEAKGFESPRWPTIKKLWRFYGPGSLDIWKGSWSKLVLDEVIIPVSGGSDDE